MDEIQKAYRKGYQEGQKSVDVMDCFRTGQKIERNRLQPKIDALEKEIARLKGQRSSLLEQSSSWFKVLPEQMICLILGAPGSGKSATGHAILELFKDKLKPFLFNFPGNKHYLLPDWMGVETDFSKIPYGSIILVDESHLTFHARQSIFGKEMRKLSEEMGVARHRAHNILFVAHSTRHIDKNIADYANVFIFKKPGAMEAKFDRPELRGVVKRAIECFNNAYNPKPLNYVWTPSQETSLMMELSTYWTDELSRAYADGIEAAETAKRPPAQQTREEKRAQVKAWHAAGASYGEIAKHFGVSKPTVGNWLKE